MATTVEFERRGTEGAEVADRAISRPVRVCFLIDRLANGGTETQLLALIRNLDPAVVKPYLVLLDGDDAVSPAMEPSDFPVTRLGVKKLIAAGTIGRLIRFVRFLWRERIDVLQLYFPDSTYFGVPAGRLAGVRAIVRTRNNVNHWMTTTHRILGRLLNPMVTATLCNTEAARQAVLADERPDPESVLVIENGVDLERFAHLHTANPECGPTRPRRVGMVANLRPVKGVDLFVQAASIVARVAPDGTFRVAGEGPQRADLERLVGQLGLSERFELHGRVENIPTFLGELDVAVLSSRAEGLPNAVLEYMAAGRPIVAAAVGGVPRVVSDGACARLVSPGSPESIASAVIDLLKDPREARRLAEAARRRVTTHFSRESSVYRFQGLFRELSGLGIAGAPGGQDDD